MQVNINVMLMETSKYPFSRNLRMFWKNNKSFKNKLLCHMQLSITKLATHTDARFPGDGGSQGIRRGMRNKRISNHYCE